MVVRVRVPEVPVMVIVTVPTAAPLLAATVQELLPVEGFGLNEAVTPLGNVEFENVTFPVKLFCCVIVMVLLPLVPCTTFNVFGVADSTKVGAGLTVRVTNAVLVKLPDVPVTVIVAVPVVAVPLADSVSVLTSAVLLGLNEAVTPLGRPEADKVTSPLNPFNGVTVIPLVPVLPCTTLMLDGDAAREKLGAGLTVSETEVVVLRLPEVPVIVMLAAPTLAALLALKVRVLVSVLASIVGFGLNDAVTPAGRPDALNVTAPLKPFCGTMLIVLEVLVPCTTLTPLGAADNVYVAGRVIDTLSNFAVATEPGLFALSARPMYTF